MPRARPGDRHQGGQRARTRTAASTAPAAICWPPWTPPWSGSGTDYVDLWQVHAFDPHTPLEETLQALDIAVSQRPGAVCRACPTSPAGSSPRPATWQLAAPGVRTRLASTQMEYSLLQRGVEREVLPAALDLGIGLLPSSPLGRGVLTGKYRHGTPADSRGASEHLAPFVAPYLDETASRIVDAVATAADGLATTPSRSRSPGSATGPGVTAPIVGARNAQQLTAALSVETLSLPDEICQGARRCVGARAPLSRSGLEHAVSTDRLATDRWAKEASTEAERRRAPRPGWTPRPWPLPRRRRAMTPWETPMTPGKRTSGTRTCGKRT